MEFKHTIWSSEIDLEDWKDDRESICEDYGKEDCSDEEFWELVNDLNSEYYYDEFDNLNKEVGTIICLADLGLWNGRRDAHQEVGTNLQDILSFDTKFGGSRSWGADENNEIVGVEHHHDGTNYYTFRKMRDGYSVEDLEDAGFTDENIEKYTESLYPYAAEIYGWAD